MEKGAKFIYLITDSSSNQSVQTFYEKVGWQVESEFTTPEGRQMRRYCKKAPHPNQEIRT